MLHMKLRTAGLAAAAVLLFQPLVAQEPDTVPIPLADLQVTVLRTNMRVLEAPYAVSIVTGVEATRGRPGLSLDEALRALPGVQVDNRHNFALGERISVRGFGARSQFGVRGVRVFLDGIPATLPDGQSTLDHVDPSRIGRVEVVRGPASALYGNAAGGVIQLETEGPPAGSRNELRVVAGDHGLLRLEGTSGATYGRTGFHVGGSRFEWGGHRQHMEATTRRVTARVDHLTDAGLIRIAATGGEYDALNPGGLTATELAQDRTGAAPFNVQRNTGKTGRHAQLGALWRHALAAGVQAELAAFGVYRDISNAITVRLIDFDRRGGGARALLTGGVPLTTGVRWGVGAEAEVQRDDRQNYFNNDGERGALALDQLERVTSLATFAQGTATLARPLDLLAGVRYDRFRFGVTDRFITDTDPDDSGARVMHALSPSAGALLRVGGAVRVFANIATAFETPTTTELANRPDGAGGFNPELDPQRTTSYELGAKGRIAQGLLWEVTGYRAHVEDQLISFEVPDAPGRTFFRNAGASRHDGVELALAGAPLPWLRTRLAFTHLDARFRDYTVGATDLSGNRVPGVAPRRVEAALTFLPRGAWYGGIELRHAGETPATDANDAHSVAYTVVDARMGVERARVGVLTLSPFLGVANLFDAAYDAAVAVNAVGGRYYEPAPGRTLHVGLAVGWGVAR
jgi:iron complex outermembrane recepter protein